MTNSEAKRIINSYKPTEGYADLSVKPDKLSFKEYAGVLKMQSMIIRIKSDEDNYKVKNPIRYEIFKRSYEKDYKTIVLEYWNIEESGKVYDNR